MSQPSSKDQTPCWLIEHKDGGWLHGNPDHEDGFGWSSDPIRAIRFCRKVDAEWAMARLGLNVPDLIFASEHVFLPASGHETSVSELDRVTRLMNQWREGYEQMAARLRAAETSPQAPIAKLNVWENGIQVTASLYAPGLPPGEHDVYLDPTAPALKATVDRCHFMAFRQEQFRCTEPAGHQGPHKCGLAVTTEPIESGQKASVPQQPPIDNEHVARGCEKFDE